MRRIAFWYCVDRHPPNPEEILAPAALRKTLHLRGTHKKSAGFRQVSSEMDDPQGDGGSNQFRSGAGLETLAGIFDMFVRSRNRDIEFGGNLAVGKTL